MSEPQVTVVEEKRKAALGVPGRVNQLAGEADAGKRVLIVDQNVRFRATKGGPTRAGPLLQLVQQALRFKSPAYHRSARAGPDRGSVEPVDSQGGAGRVLQFPRIARMVNMRMRDDDERDFVRIDAFSLEGIEDLGRASRNPCVNDDGLCAQHQENVHATRADDGKGDLDDSARCHYATLSAEGRHLDACCIGHGGTRPAPPMIQGSCARGLQR